ncbi:hypothetical protein F5Y15DRAFT_156715 [Xylariaceae sp. FL0016]|nr:hypothetical protein F5Y15DRAFT_156715 [Xylariaceae sp. FL0016]
MGRTSCAGGLLLRLFYYAPSSGTYNLRNHERQQSRKPFSTPPFLTQLLEGSLPAANDLPDLQKEGSSIAPHHWCQGNAGLNFTHHQRHTYLVLLSITISAPTSFHQITRTACSLYHSTDWTPLLRCYGRRTLALPDHVTRPACFKGGVGMLLACM